MNPEIIVKAAKMAQKNVAYATATIVEVTSKGTPQKIGAKMIVFSDGSQLGTIGGGKYEKEAQKECLKALKTKKPKLITYDYFGKKGQSICGGQIKVFIEPFTVSRTLVLCGAGHIALPLSIIGKMLNYKVIVIDNRKEFANKRRFSHVDKVILGNHSKILKKLKIDTNTDIIIITHGHAHDFDCLKAVVKSNAGYIGVISSRTKKSKFMKALKKLKIRPNYLKKVHMPTGIDIGAQIPEEIAISISAQLIANYNKDFLDSDKFKN